METENRYNLPKDTFDWLMEIGAIDISKFVYSTMEPQMLYSEDYLKNTPLEELKAGYEQQLPQKDMNTLHIENGRTYVNGTEITCIESLNIRREDSINCGLLLVELRFLAKDITSLKTQL